MVLRAAVGAGGRVSQRVLVAGLLGNTGIEFLYILALQPVIDVAARIVGVLGKPLKPTVEKSASHANTIDRDVVAKQLLDGGVVVIGVELGSIHAVGDQKNDFPPLAFRVAVFEQLGRGIDGVVERLGGLALKNHGGPTRVRGVTDGRVAVDGGSFVDGRAGRRHGRLFVQPGTLQFGDQLVLVADESFALMEKLVEAADKSFIAFAHAGNDGHETVRNLAGVLGFQVVIDEHDHGQGKSFGAEKNNSLFDVVFENAEFFLAQVGDQATGAILHNDRHNHLIHIKH